MRETEKKKNTNLSFDEVEILPLTQFDPYKLVFRTITDWVENLSNRGGWVGLANKPDPCTPLVS